MRSGVRVSGIVELVLSMGLDPAHSGSHPPPSIGPVPYRECTVEITARSIASVKVLFLFLRRQDIHIVGQIRTYGVMPHPFQATQDYALYVSNRGFVRMELPFETWGKWQGLAPVCGFYIAGHHDPDLAFEL
jgi:hypothetical protein